MRRFCILAAAAALSITPAFADDVPTSLNGHWAVDGQCDSKDNSIHIEAGKLAMGTAAAADITYFTDDSPSGNGAIHWAEEGSVDNFEYAPDQDELLYNGEGYGMGVAAIVYKRCT